MKDAGACSSAGLARATGGGIGRVQTPLPEKAMKEAVVERRIEDLADIRLVIANGETHVNRLAERRPS